MCVCNNATGHVDKCVCIIDCKMFLSVAAGECVSDKAVLCMIVCVCVCLCE